MRDLFSEAESDNQLLRRTKPRRSRFQSASVWTGVVDVLQPIVSSPFRIFCFLSGVVAFLCSSSSSSSSSLPHSSCST